MEHKSVVLIVDDESSARDTLEALLFPKGYDLVFAASGQEVLDRLGELAPDVILLDVMMPGMDGLQVCRHLKAEKQWRHIPIIMVTALDSKQDLARGLEAGADDFVHKPVNGIELRARVRSMLRIKKQYDELEATLRLREDLSNLIVHDLRNPLASIMLFGALLKRSLTTPQDLERLDKLLTAGRRLESLINDLLIMAKTQADKLVLNRTLADANQLVSAALENHYALAQSRGIELSADLPEQSHPLPLDENLFQRVLDNLLSNAIKFSPNDSAITLRVAYAATPASQESRVRIQVIDQGPGIAAADRERIFDPFEIIEMKKKKVAQTGLGLAFAKMVINAHGGRISVAANQPQGSIFTVEIPNPTGDY
jgi:two-component system sensor histidine kinase/response regulator